MRRLTNKNDFLYALASVLFTILTNQTVYQGVKLINLRYPAWDIAMPIDYTFKTVPWTISIYVGAYIIWFVSYFVIAMQDDRKQSERFFSAVLVSRPILLFIFLVIPTTANLRQEVTGTGIWNWMLSFIYTADSPAVNYFPSLHCMASWFCVIGVRGKKEFPLWWRIASYLLAFAVFVSVITTRQHVLIDIPGGIVFAELCYAISDFEGVQRFYTRISTWIMVHICRRPGLEG